MMSRKARLRSSLKTSKQGIRRAGSLRRRSDRRKPPWIPLLAARCDQTRSFPLTQAMPPIYPRYQAGWLHWRQVSIPDTASRVRGARLRRGCNRPASKSPASTRACSSEPRSRLDLTGIVTQAARQLTPKRPRGSKHIAQRRLAGEPVARILGAKEFWGLPLQLSPATLVPRPDTETVVELALEMLRAGGESIARCASPISAPAPARSCWRCCPNCRASGFGTDISRSGACRPRRANAARTGPRGRADFVACDYAAALSGPFDLIVSNPPYIRSAEIAGSGRRGARSRSAGGRWTAALTGLTPIAR